MMDPIGYWITCDDALCASCAPAGFASGDYSQWAGFESWESPAAIFSDSESDSCTHCSACRELIPHRLTREGYEGISEALSRALDGDQGSAIAAWMDQYGDEVDIPVQADEYGGQFIAGYCEAMLWANTREYREGCDGKSCDENAPGECGGHDCDPSSWRDNSDYWQLEAFAPASRESIEADCTAFIRGNWADLGQADYGNRGSEYGSAQCAGHDFALSRNGHGTGFSDRGLGAIGDRLQAAARAWGESTAWYAAETENVRCCTIAGAHVHLDDES